MILYYYHKQTLLMEKIDRQLLKPLKTIADCSSHVQKLKFFVKSQVKIKVFHYKAYVTKHQ